MKLFAQNLISLRLGHTLFIFVSIASLWYLAYIKSVVGI